MPAIIENKIFLWRIQPDFTLKEILIIPSPQSLDQASLNLPGGAYTTFRTYDRIKALCLEEHFKRLEESAILVGKAVLINRNEVRKLLRKAIDLTDFGDMRIRVTLDIDQEPGTMYISIEKLKVLPPDTYKEGIRVITTKLQRENPKAKLTAFISTSGQIRKLTGEDINEILMVDNEDRILEGITSNFFAIIDGQLWTAEDGVLSGVTRKLAIEAALKKEIALVFTACRLSDVPVMQEAFITSASRGILPVVKINNTLVGVGHPGKITQTLMEFYINGINLEIEEI